MASSSFSYLYSNKANFTELCRKASDEAGYIQMEGFTFYREGEILRQGKIVKKSEKDIYIDAENILVNELLDESAKDLILKEGIGNKGRHYFKVKSMLMDYNNHIILELTFDLRSSGSPEEIYETISSFNSDTYVVPDPNGFICFVIVSENNEDEDMLNGLLGGDS